MERSHRTMRDAKYNHEIDELHDLAKKLDLWFDFRFKDMAENEKTFTCSLKIGDFTAEGRGKTKWNAKIEAAKQVLVGLRSLLIRKDTTQKRNNTAYVSGCKKDLKPDTNPVFCLKNMVNANQGKPPEYIVLSRRGDVMFRVQVTVAGESVVGTGPTYNEAKWNAAGQMLKTFGYSFPYTDLQQKVPPSFTQGASAAPLIKDTREHTQVTPCTSNQKYSLQVPKVTQRKTRGPLKEAPLFKPGMTPMFYLKHLVTDKQGQPPEYIVLSRRGDVMFRVQATVGGKRVVGTGRTDIEAKWNAASKMLQTFGYSFPYTYIQENVTPSFTQGASAAPQNKYTRKNTQVTPCTSNQKYSLQVPEVTQRKTRGPLKEALVFKPGMTPIFYLKHLVNANQGQPPEYIVLSRLGDVMFRVQVTVAGERVVGTGPTYNEAKWNAAGQMLNMFGISFPYTDLQQKVTPLFTQGASAAQAPQLNDTREDTQVTPCTSTKECSLQVPELTQRETRGPLKEAPLFKPGMTPMFYLKQLVNAKQGQPPEYNVLSRLGDVMFRVQVTVTGKRVVGTGPTYDEAKWNAADQMLNTFGYSFPYTDLQQKVTPLFTQGASAAPQNYDTQEDTQVTPCSSNQEYSLQVPEVTQRETPEVIDVISSVAEDNSEQKGTSQEVQEGSPEVSLDVKSNNIQEDTYPVGNISSSPELEISPVPQKKTPEVSPKGTVERAQDVTTLQYEELQPDLKVMLTGVLPFIAEMGLIQNHSETVQGSEPETTETIKDTPEVTQEGSHLVIQEVAQGDAPQIDEDALSPVDLLAAKEVIEDHSGTMQWSEAKTTESPSEMTAMLKNGITSNKTSHGPQNQSETTRDTSELIQEDPSVLPADILRSVFCEMGIVEYDNGTLQWSKQKTTGTIILPDADVKTEGPSELITELKNEVKVTQEGSCWAIQEVAQSEAPQLEKVPPSVDLLAAVGETEGSNDTVQRSEEVIEDRESPLETTQTIVADAKDETSHIPQDNAAAPCEKVQSSNVDLQTLCPKMRSVLASMRVVKENNGTVQWDLSKPRRRYHESQTLSPPENTTTLIPLEAPVETESNGNNTNTSSQTTVEPDKPENSRQKKTTITIVIEMTCKESIINQSNSMDQEEREADTPKSHTSSPVHHFGPPVYSILTRALVEKTFKIAEVCYSREECDALVNRLEKKTKHTLIVGDDTEISFEKLRKIGKTAAKMLGTDYGSRPKLLEAARRPNDEAFEAAVVKYLNLELKAYQITHKKPINNQSDTTEKSLREAGIPGSDISSPVLHFGPPVYSILTRALVEKTFKIAGVCCSREEYDAVVNRLENKTIDTLIIGDDSEISSEKLREIGKNAAKQLLTEYGSHSKLLEAARRPNDEAFEAAVVKHLNVQLKTYQNRPKSALSRFFSRLSRAFTTSS